MVGTSVVLASEAASTKRDRTRSIQYKYNNCVDFPIPEIKRGIYKSDRYEFIFKKEFEMIELEMHDSYISS